MSTTLMEIIKQAEQLSLSEQLELIAYLAQRSRALADAQRSHYRWSDIAGIIDGQLFGEDAQAYISRTREESDHLREQGFRAA